MSWAKVFHLKCLIVGKGSGLGVNQLGSSLGPLGAGPQPPAAVYLGEVACLRLHGAVGGLQRGGGRSPACPGPYSICNGKYPSAE